MSDRNMNKNYKLYIKEHIINANKLDIKIYVKYIKYIYKEYIENINKLYSGIKIYEIYNECIQRVYYRYNKYIKM